MNVDAYRAEQYWAKFDRDHPTPKHSATPRPPLSFWGTVGAIVMAVLVLGMLSGCASAPVKGEWMQVGGGWCYQTEFGCSTGGPAVTPTRAVSDSTWGILQAVSDGVANMRNLPTPK